MTNMARYKKEQYSRHKEVQLIKYCPITLTHIFRYYYPANLAFLNDFPYVLTVYATNVILKIAY